MANFIITRNGAFRLCTAVANQLTATFANYVRLWQNDIEPSFDTVLADLQECSAAGYTGVPADFSALTLIEGTDNVGITGLACNFTFSAYVGAPKIVYGAWVEDDGPELTAVKRFGAPYVIPNAGGNLVVTPIFRFRNIV